MRVIAHISDLHFGKLQQPTVQPLADELHALRPDLVAISGDLTQRARRGQFRAAREYLNRLPGPQIVVPGNHDLPLFNLPMRFLTPLRGYHKWISEDMTPVWMDDELVVVGVNTSRRLERKGGKIGEDQVERICRAFEAADQGQCRIVVTHHPFDLPPHLEHKDNLLIGRSAMAMEQFARCGVELFLAGHLHVSHRGSAARYGIPGYTPLIVQAGTATSSRYRGEANAWNIIRIGPDHIDVETRAWQPFALRFSPAQTERFARDVTPDLARRHPISNLSPARPPLPTTRS